MRAGDATTDDGRTLTVRVALTVRKRGGRKQVVMPDGACWGQPRPRVDNTMVKALARAFRWRKLLEAGVFGTVEEIAKAEKINASYVSRLLRMTLLAPEIVEMILNGQLPLEITLATLIKPFPLSWAAQRQTVLGQ